jgi:cystathionine gamma-lyase
VHKGLDYGRSHNPTRWALERCVADIEERQRGLCLRLGPGGHFGGARTAAAGSHIVAGDDMYGGTYRLFERVRRKSAGHDFTYVNLADPRRCEARCAGDAHGLGRDADQPDAQTGRPGGDRAAVPRARHHHRVCDNTFASPIVQRPLELASTSWCTRPPST